jgi:hypothetical protein
VIAIVILIGMIIGVRELIEKYQKEKVVETADINKVSPLPPQPPEPPPAATTSEENKDAAAVEPTDVESEPAPPPAKPEVKAETKPEVKEVKSEPVKQPEPKPPVKAEAKPEVKQEVKPEAKPEVKPQAKPEPKAATAKTDAAKPDAKDAKTDAKPAKVVKSVIILEALDKVEVKFQVKGQWKKVALAPMEVHTIHADQSMPFEFSDGGSINVIVDGHERGPPGELGKPKQVTLP